MVNKTNKVEIEIPVGKVVKWVNDVLTLVDENPQDITKRIKTFDDALLELDVRASNGDNTAKMLYHEWYNVTTNSDDLDAFLKLRIITAALNEGWDPKFTKGERRFYVLYDLITKEQYCKLSSEDKSRAVYRRGCYACASVFASYAESSVCYSLAFKNKKLAVYASRQFADIYACLCLK